VPSAGPHSWFQITEQAIERTHIAKEILRQVRIRSLLLLLPLTWNLKPGTCERLPIYYVTTYTSADLVAGRFDFDRDCAIERGRQ